MKFFFLVVLAVLILSCSTKESEVERAMQKYDQFIFRMAADSIADCFTESGKLGGEGSPLVFSRDSIRKFLKSFDMSGIKMIANQSKTKSISFRGDTAILEGRYEQRAEMNGTEGVYTGGFTSKWLQSKKNGRWLLQWMYTVPDKK